MSKLIYPTLGLFLYDLRDTLGETEADIERNRAEFRQKLPKPPEPGEPDELLAALAGGDSPEEAACSSKITESGLKIGGDSIGLRDSTTQSE